MLLLSFVGNKRWEGRKLITHDAAYYWIYMPAVYIYQDLGFGFPKHTKEDGDVWFGLTERGGSYSKMTCGTAVLYSPFFFVGHVVSKVLPNYRSNGYSLPYSISVSIGAIIYCMLALFILRKILLRYFSEVVTALTLFILVFGTNLFYYAAIEGLMSHVYSFFVFSALLWTFLKWLKKPSLGNWVLMGFLLGLITLIRPTNGLIGFIPLWFLVKQLASKTGMEYWKKNGWYLLPAAIAFGLVIFIQMVFWKLGPEKWIFYSYRNEGFFFNDPKIWKGLFGFRKGWLIYAPLMTFSLMGLFFLKDELKKFKWPIAIFFLAHVYVIYSWWNWWYGGSFGSRPMIEIMPFLALPLASFLAFVFKQKKAIKYSVVAVVSFLVFLSVYQTDQYRRGIIHYNAMTWPAYKGIFLKRHAYSGYWELMDEPDTKAARAGIGR